MTMLKQSDYRNLEGTSHESSPTNDENSSGRSMWEKIEKIGTDLAFSIKVDELLEELTRGSKTIGSLAIRGVSKFGGIVAGLVSDSKPTNLPEVYSQLPGSTSPRIGAALQAIGAPVPTSTVDPSLVSANPAGFVMVEEGYVLNPNTGGVFYSSGELFSPLDKGTLGYLQYFGARSEQKAALLEIERKETDQFLLNSKARREGIERFEARQRKDADRDAAARASQEELAALQAAQEKADRDAAARASQEEELVALQVAQEEADRDAAAKAVQETESARQEAIDLGFDVGTDAPVPAAPATAASAGTIDLGTAIGIVSSGGSLDNYDVDVPSTDISYDAPDPGIDADIAAELDGLGIGIGY